MEVEYRKKRRGKRHNGEFQRFDGDTDIKEILRVLGYRLQNIKDGKADLWQGSRCLLKDASGKTILGWLIFTHPRRFENTEVMR